MTTPQSNTGDAPRNLPTQLLVDTYNKVGSYRGAARELGVSVQFLHQRIKKHGKNVKPGKFVNYHAMSRQELLALIQHERQEAALEAKDEILDELLEWYEVKTQMSAQPFNWYGAVKALKVSKDFKKPFAIQPDGGEI